MTISLTFFSPHIALRPLKTLKKPGPAIDVRPCILFAFVAFFRTLRTYLVGVRWSMDSSSFCVRHASAVLSPKCGPGARALRWAQVPDRIVKLCVRLVMSRGRLW